LLSGDIASSRAEALAFESLKRAGAEDFAELEPAALDPAETMRVALARAVVTRPRLLVVDEPTTGVRASQERPLLALLHSFARDDGVAVLMTADDAAALVSVDRALTINAGVVRGSDPGSDAAETEDADRVVPLRMPRSR
jgi:ABC-type Mn2+/Zn2+ transport system ATPase subunit